MVPPESISSRSFTATVTGEEEYDSAVTWDISGNKSTKTKISENGKLTIASGETATELIVTATSVQDQDFSASAKVTVTKPSSSANTGDRFNMTLWIGLMVLCAGGVAVLVYVNKKKKK